VVADFVSIVTGSEDECKRRQKYRCFLKLPCEDLQPRGSSPTVRGLEAAQKALPEGELLPRVSKVTLGLRKLRKREILIGIAEKKV